MRRLLFALGWVVLCHVAAAAVVPEPGTIEGHWDNGAEDCNARRTPPLQVQRYNDDTYVLRESLCRTYEGPFIYLLIGQTRALLIDTGDVADAGQMPLASTVLGLLPTVQGRRLPLLVAHTHGHLDHRAGDAQFAGASDVSVLGTGLPQVIQGYGFQHWPDDVPRIDLGGRQVAVIATPGHYPSEVSFYDERSGLVFTGDFLLPGRLVIDDIAADRASAARLNAYLRDKPVNHVLGGHVELDRHDQLEPQGSNWHPDEAPLALDRAELSRLPQVLAGFNGFYVASGRYVMYSQTRMLQVIGVAAALLLLVIVLSLRWWLGRRRHARAGHL